MENKNPQSINIRVDIPRPTTVAASSLVLLAAVGLWICMVLLSCLPGFEGVLQMMTVTNLLYYLPFTLLPVVIYLIRRSEQSSAVRLNPMPLFPLLSVIVMALLTTMIASMLVSLWAIPLEALGLTYPDTAFIPTNTRELMIAIIVMAAIPAVCEELLFRGVVMSAWESRGTKYAVIMSAVLFSLIHGNIFGLPAYLMVGLLSGYLVFALDTIYAGIIFHTLYNTACLVFSYILENPAAVERSAAAAESVSSAGMVAAMIIEFVLMALMMVMNLVTMRARRRILGIEPIPRIRSPLSTRETGMLILCLIPMITQFFIY